MNKGVGWVLILGVAVATLLVLGLQTPEMFSVTSSDHLATLAGRITNGTRPTLTIASQSLGASSLGAPVYEIGPSATRFPVPFTLSITVTQGDLAQPIAILEKDTSVGGWRTVPTTLDPSGPTLTATIGEGGDWTVGPVLTLPDTQTLRAMLGDLLQAKPDEAVAYQADVLVSQHSSDFELVRSGFSVGGCGGTFANGSSTRAVSVDRVINDETVRVRLVWQLGNGCAAGKSLSETR